MATDSTFGSFIPLMREAPAKCLSLVEEDYSTDHEAHSDSRRSTSSSVRCSRSRRIVAASAQCDCP
jgi:hypothetical protein